MEPQTLSAEVRQLGGKGPARQLRKRGLIPAIFYGPAVEPQKLALSPTALEAALRRDFGRNQLLELQFDGQTALAVVKDLALDPVSREILHADLYAVSKDRMVETEVPFHAEGRAAGVQKGGSMRKLFRTLPVRAFPQDVPASITLDVTPLDINAEVRVSELPLPSGVTVTLSPERRVLVIEAKERKKEEEEEAAAPA